MKTVLPKQIKKVEISLDPSDNEKFISVYYKNGEMDQYKATLQSDDRGIVPNLRPVHSIRFYDIPPRKKSKKSFVLG